MTQRETILSIMRRDGEISSFYAIEHKITLRLAARIFELRQKGYVIDMEELPSHNTIYKLIAEPEPVQLTL